MPKKLTPTSEVTNSATSKLPEFMRLRGQTYYFVRKLPADVARTLSTDAPAYKSLRTSDIDEAKVALAKELAAFDAQVARARAGKKHDRAGIKKLKERADGTTKYLVQAHIPVLLDGFEFAHLTMDDQERKEMTREERALRLQEFEEGLEHLYEDRAAEDYSAWEEVVDDMLKSECLIAPPNSNIRKELVRELALRDIEILEVQCIRLKGKGKSTPKAPPSARGLPTLRDLFLQWKKKQTRHRTVSTYETCVAEFEAIHGALPAAAIEPIHVQQYRDWLLETELMHGTASNRIGGLATLFRFGQKEIVANLMFNPFETVDLSGFSRTAPSEERRAYAMRELKELFDSKLYRTNFQPEGQTKEALYWAPLLGTFVGGRIEEIAQLRIEDIENVSGEWSVRITESGPDQKNKTYGSSRRVPLHREVIRCGFLAYVAEQKLNGSERVFPSLLNENENGVWSGALTTRYGRYLDEIGLTDPRVDFHSFRYSFRQQCSICGIENEVRDALTGHWLDKQDAGRTYMKEEDRQYSFPPLVAAIKAFQYVGLDLSHMYVNEPMKDVMGVLAT